MKLYSDCRSDSTMREIKATFGEIEKPQKFISKEFNNFKQTLQLTKKDSNEVSIKVKNL